VHHFVFAYDGRGVLLAAVLGTFWACMAKAALTILQILVAKGWAILFTPNEKPQRIAIVLAITGVISISVGCEVWEQFFHDQSTSFYLYESWPGRIILMLNIVLLVTAWTFLWKSYKREVEPQVRSFYAFTAVACGIYFASLPAVCLLAELLSPWVVRNRIERVEVSTRFVATAMLAVGLRPSNMHRLVSARLKNRDAPELLNTEEMMDTA
jgi:surface polysaccharide O-acyltransferase-like enzyme